MPQYDQSLILTLSKFKEECVTFQWLSLKWISSLKHHLFSLFNFTKTVLLWYKTQHNKTGELLTHSVLRGEMIHNVAQDKRTPTQHNDKRYFI